MTATLLSEWTKLRTQRGALVALCVMVVLMVGMTAWAAPETHTDAVFGGDDDVVQIGPRASSSRRSQPSSPAPRSSPPSTRPG